MSRKLLILEIVYAFIVVVLMKYINLLYECTSFFI